MIIYLASSSKSRFALLKDAGFNVLQIQHYSDEIIEDKNSFISVVDFVSEVVDLKMASVNKKFVCEEAEKNNSTSFILLAADTETIIENGIVLGKPSDLEHAKNTFLALSNKKIMVSTAFKCEIYKKIDNQWRHVSSEKVSSITEIIIEWTEEDIEKYIEDEGIAILTRSGGLGIEGRGSVFVKSVFGSYTNVLGLPMFELYQVLKKYI
jgi:septum formation protein